MALSPLVPTIHAETLPEPEAIRNIAREVLDRPEFQQRTVRFSMGPLPQWLEDLFRWLWTPFRWVVEGISEAAQVIGWPVVVILVVLLVVLIAHIVYTMIVAIRQPRRSRPVLPSEGAIQTPANLEQQAALAVSRKDFVSAIRCLFQACLLRLAAGEKRTFRPGMTNREYLRRYRSSPIAQPLGLFVETIDAKWYGEAPCETEDYEACRQAHADIRHYSELNALNTAGG